MPAGYPQEQEAVASASSLSTPAASSSFANTMGYGTCSTQPLWAMCGLGPRVCAVPCVAWALGYVRYHVWPRCMYRRYVLSYTHALSLHQSSHYQSGPHHTMSLLVMHPCLNTTSVITLSVITSSVIMLSVITTSVITLSVTPHHTYVSPLITLTCHPSSHNQAPLITLSVMPHQPSHYCVMHPIFLSD